MTLKKNKNNYFNEISDISIVSQSKELSMIYAANLDLYWRISGTHNLNLDEIFQIDFEITKENYQIFQQFQMLFESLERLEISDSVDILGDDFVCDKERLNDLYRGDKIIWYSDETNKKVANYLEIVKKFDSFIISFNTQPHIRGYSQDTHNFDSISIRFSNSGSRYEPLNVLFMKMFNALQSIDDVYDEGHQIHIEEYLYELEIPLSRRKKY